MRSVKFIELVDFVTKTKKHTKTSENSIQMNIFLSLFKLEKNS